MLAETVDQDESEGGASPRELGGFNGAIGKGIADLVVRIHYLPSTNYSLARSLLNCLIL
jgi:hypothetical protein